MSTKKEQEVKTYKTKEEAEELITHILKDIKQQFETNKDVRPQAVLLTDYDPGSRTKDGTFEKRMTINHFDLTYACTTPEEVIKTSSTLRQAALECGGFCSIVAGSSWMVEGDAKRSKSSLALHPKRQQIVQVNVEHKKLGARVYAANVIQEKNDKTLSEFKQLDVNRIRTGFERILPNSAN